MKCCACKKPHHTLAQQLGKASELKQEQCWKVFQLLQPVMLHPPAADSHTQSLPLHLPNMHQLHITIQHMQNSQACMPRHDLQRTTLDVVCRKLWMCITHNHKVVTLSSDIKLSAHARAGTADCTAEDQAAAAGTDTEPYCTATPAQLPLLRRSSSLVLEARPSAKVQRMPTTFCKPRKQLSPCTAHCT